MSALAPSDQGVWSARTLLVQRPMQPRSSLAASCHGLDTRAQLRATVWCAHKSSTKRRPGPLSPSAAPVATLPLPLFLRRIVYTPAPRTAAVVVGQDASLREAAMADTPAANTTI